MLGAIFSAASGASLGTLFVRLTADSTSLVAGITAAERTIERSSAAMLAQVRLLAVGVTAAMAVVGAVSVKAASDFESSFAGVRKTVDATEAEFKKLEDQMRGLAKVLPANVNEINRIAEAAGALGIQNSAIVGFTETMIRLGTTTNLSSLDAADKLARLANITQMSQKDFDKLGATLVGLGNTMAATESEIAEMALRIAGAGTEVGMSEAQILGFASALSSVGIQAEMGGSAISQAMIRMAKAVAQGGENLDKFAQAANMSVTDFSKLFRENAAEAIIRFMEGLNRMSKSGEDVFTFLEELQIDGIRMTDMFLRASNAGDLFRDALAKGNKAWAENAALVNASNERYNTFASQLTITKNLFNDMFISIGQQLVPVLKVLNSMLQDMMKSQDGANSSMSKFINNIGPAFLTLVGLIGDALWGWKLIIKAGELAFEVWAGNLLSIFALILQQVDWTLNKMVQLIIDRINQAIRAFNLLLPKAKELSELKFTPQEFFGTSEVEAWAQGFIESARDTMKEIETLASEGSFSERLQKKWEAVTKVVTDQNQKMVNDTLKATQMITSLWTTSPGSPGATAAEFSAVPGPSQNTPRIFDDSAMAMGMMNKMGMPDQLLGGGRGMRGLEDPRLAQAMHVQQELQLAQENLKMLEELNNMDLQLTEEAQAQKIAMLEAYNEKVRQLQSAQVQIVLGTATQIFGDLTKIAESTAGKQSGIYKAMFAASKAFAIAESIVKIQQGIANAASLPFPANLVAIGTVVAATASIVSTIKSTSLDSTAHREMGGSVMAGRSYVVGESGEELFQPNRSGRIISNDMMSGGANVKVIVNNYTDARATVTESNEGNERVIEVVVRRVKNEIGSEIRDGRGDIAKSMESSYKLRRGT